MYKVALHNSACKAEKSQLQLYSQTNDDGPVCHTLLLSCKSVANELETWSILHLWSITASILS